MTGYKYSLAYVGPVPLHISSVVSSFVPGMVTCARDSALVWCGLGSSASLGKKKDKTALKADNFVCKPRIPTPSFQSLY